MRPISNFVPTMDRATNGYRMESPIRDVAVWMDILGNGARLKRMILMRIWHNIMAMEVVEIIAPLELRGLCCWFLH